MRPLVRVASDLYGRWVTERPSQRFQRVLSRSMTVPDFLSQAQSLCNRGVLLLPRFFGGDVLQRMQEDFERWVAGKELDETGMLSLHEDNGAKLRDSVVFSWAAVHPILTSYVSYYWGKPILLAQTCGMRLEPRQTGNYRAFQWHHDAKGKQVKVMILLTDVPPTGQRMDYLPGTHRLWHRWRTYEDTRFADQAVERYGEPIRCGGAAGTVVLFDTNGLHRGNRNLGPRRDVWVFHYTAGASLFPLSGLHPEVVQQLSGPQRRIVRLPPASPWPGAN